MKENDHLKNYINKTKVFCLQKSNIVTFVKKKKNNLKKFRVKMCAEVNKNYFYVAHHEMGHCQYFLNYGREQPYFFQVKKNKVLQCL